MNDFEYIRFYWDFVDRQEDILQKYIYKLDVSDVVAAVFQRFSNVDLNKLISNKEVLRLHQQIGIWLQNGLNEPSYQAILRYFKKKKRIYQRERLSLWLLAALCVYYQMVLKKSVDIFQKAADHSYKMAWKQAGEIEKNGHYTPLKQIDNLMKEVNPSFGITLEQRLWSDAQHFRNVLLSRYNTLILKGKAFEVNREQKLFQKIEDLLLKNSKPDKQELNGHHGIIDKQMTFIIGYTVIKAFRDAGVKKYKFIATIDERTTDSCRLLNGKVFYVDEAKIGINVPPIADPPHPCRSVIRAVYSNK